MQEVKYYAPEIEEFCEGFEYEIFDDFDFYEAKTWHKFKYTIGDVERMHFPIPVSEKIRVKYLDKEDIESLTFVFYKEFPTNYIGETCYTFHSEKLNLMLGFYPKSSIVSLATKDPSKNKIFSDTSADPNRINRIKVKNKSEFKKLLKQLDTNGTN